MATAILSSQPSLNHRFNPNSRHSRHYSYAPTTTAPPPPRRRKRTTTTTKKTVVEFPAAKHTNLVMGQVKILKRGESLTSFQNNKENSKPNLKTNDDVDLVVSSINRLGPEPETVQKQIGSFKGDYAGSGCLVSPPPSSLPIPCFLVKNSDLE